jgi:hypothetical protein
MVLTASMGGRQHNAGATAGPAFVKQFGAKACQLALEISNVAVRRQGCCRQPGACETHLVVKAICGVFTSGALKSRDE